MAEEGFIREVEMKGLTQGAELPAQKVYEELKFRLDCSSDKQTEAKLRRWYNEKYGKVKPNEESYNIGVVIKEESNKLEFITQQLFASEPITAQSFVAKNLSYLDFPLEIAEMAHSSRDVAVGSLYVQKECLGDPVPQRLKVTIEEDTNGK